MVKLVIFDLDGTLLDTVDDLAVSTNHALRQCGFPEHEVPAYRFFIGNGINKLFERAMPESERNEENVRRMRNYFLIHYTNHNTDLTVPYSGIPELLRELQSRGIALAVASNKYHAGTEKLIGHYFPEIKFKAVFGQREGIPPKPNPKVVDDILDMTAIEKSAVLYVGDSGVDMQTASNSRIKSIGVSWGFRPLQELIDNGANVIIDIPSELLTLI